jgi:hypothetical protein
LIEGEERREKANPVMTIVNTVDLDYFSTLGIGMTAGRDFSS